MADYGLFISKAPGIMAKLMRDFGFSLTQAAAILGNIGHECGGFHLMQEVNPVGGGRGGFGWCQWTGVRRRAFENFARSNGLSPTSDAANFGFLKLELQTSERGAVRALKRETGLVRAVRVFEETFLRAGVKNFPSRERYAEIAEAAFERRSAAGARSLELVPPGEDLLDEAMSASGAVEPVAAPDDMASGADDIGGDWPSSVRALESPGSLGTRIPASVAGAPQPRIFSTAEWGARAPRRPITLLPHRPKGIVIHHTTQPNTSDFSEAHAKQIARAIQDFHMQERGWIDTGQHFTVSRGGHVLEGRHRSLEAVRGGSRHVLGAHAEGSHAGESCNQRYVGIENEGLYTSALPTSQQWQALARLCAWICDQYRMDTADIIGHRQCKSTQCPGNAFFAALPRLRQDVDALRSSS